MTSFWGTKQSETIFAKNGNDTVLGLDGDDTLFGLDGDDILKGGGGADKLHGGTGNDMADYGDSSKGVAIHLADNYARFGTAEGDTFDSIESLSGSAYADELYGDGKANILYGQGGKDWLEGLAGADTIDGGSGDDIVEGGSGADKLDGGAGEHDLVHYSSSEAGVFVSLLDHIAQFGDAAGDTLDGFEDLAGSQYDDQLWGDHGANRIAGARGNDTLKGYGGNDNLEGWSGSDFLMGSDGDDVLHGHVYGTTEIIGSGDSVVRDDDTLIGGMGRDTLYGGYHADRFVWLSTAETNYTTNAPTSVLDVIKDFNPAEHDLIDLSEIDADIYSPGNQAFNFIGDAAFTPGQPGELRYYYEDGNTILQMQTGNEVDIEGAIVIVGIHTPTAGWFVL